MVAVKKEVIKIGRLLWQSGLVAGCAGNISAKTDKHNIFVTAHNCCLGILRESDIVKIGMDGKLYSKRQPTMEKAIHVAIHHHFPHKAVIHAHPPFTTGYFSVNNKLPSLTHESRLLLGDIPCVMQRTPTITNEQKVIQALKKSNIIALKKHGVIAIVNNLLEGFFLIQMLEDAVKIYCAAKIFRKQ